MNVYGNLTDFKSTIGVTGTAKDAMLLAMLQSASRYCDGFCKRHFYTTTETRYFDTKHTDEVWIDDFISLTTILADDDLDMTWGETWTENTDFYAWPSNKYPKQRLLITPTTSKSFAHFERYLKITGVWGYGNETSTPWLLTAINLTLASDSALTATASVAGLYAGQTVKCESEQLYISAIDTAGMTLTVERAVNGTTAAAHAAKAASIAQYPDPIVTATYYKAQSVYQAIQNATLQSHMIGGFQEMFRVPDTESQMDVRMMGQYRRIVI